MKVLKIKGNQELTGSIRIGGAKNSAVALIPATLLTKEKTTLCNVPNILDIDNLEITLNYLNVNVKRASGSIVIDPKNLKNKEIPLNLSKKLRASYYFMAILLAKFKYVKIHFPGGCKIGSRPIDQTLNAFRLLGAKVTEKSDYYIIEATELRGNLIELDIPSVGATINTILVAVLANGTTIIKNAACEPEISDLITMLNKMGAKIEGAGTSNIKITGVKRLKDISYNIMPDRIEAASLLCMVAATGGKIKLNNIITDNITPVINKLEECGCKIEKEKNTVYLEAPRKLKAVDIKTMPYPGFPTDMQSVFASMLTTAKGTSVIVENIFENRYKFMAELKKMGAKITIEGKTAVIKGVRKLSGAKVVSTDLRGGAALVTAGLIARGKTEITNIEYILRGYEGLDKKLQQLGAKIEIKKDE